MFEVGKSYDFTMLEWGVDGPGPVQFYRRTVAEVDGSLVKFVTAATTIRVGDVEEAIPPSEEIVNVQSLYFVSATPS